jgi:hypothetical protein
MSYYLYVYGIYLRVGVRSMGGSRKVKGWSLIEEIILVVPIKISGTMVPIEIFYFQNILLCLDLTKTSFFSNSLTERARQV